jgi:hypothetical protein
MSGFCLCLSLFCGPRIDAPSPFLKGRGCKPSPTESTFLSHGSRHSRVYGSSLKYSIGVWTCCFTTGRGMAKQRCAASRNRAVESFIILGLRICGITMLMTRISKLFMYQLVGIYVSAAARKLRKLHGENSWGFLQVGVLFSRARQFCREDPPNDVTVIIASQSGTPFKKFHNIPF